MKRAYYDIINAKPVFLAPMAGVTNSIYRSICLNHGCDLTFTEMISAKGLKYNPDNKKSNELLDFLYDQECLAIQIFGQDSEIMAEQTSELCQKFKDSLVLIDINMGCPAPKIVNNGEGCALMKEPKIAEQIIKQVVSYSQVPVSVKFRKGWKDESAKEFALMAQEAGASSITIHARTREQFYSGKADWDVIAKVKEAVNIPVVGNGDIFEAKDALNMIEYTNCDGVMVGRGAMGNPWIFEQIKALMEHKDIEAVSARQRIDMAKYHLKQMVEKKGERGIPEMRKHIAWYINSLPSSAKVRAEINKCNDVSQINYILESFLTKTEQ